VERLIEEIYHLSFSQFTRSIDGHDNECIGGGKFFSGDKKRKWLNRSRVLEW
jgi:hypothetical protein